MKIERKDIEFSKLSSGDEVGRVFFWNHKVYREINDSHEEDIRNLFQSGLIDKLVQEKLFPKTFISNDTLEVCNLLIEHERIPSITYPYEWSFEMLRQAAITVLRVGEIALTYGYQMKDCHSFNVAFHGTLPLYMDLGSFIKSDKSQYWMCYEEFLKSYEYLLRIGETNEYHFVKQLSISDSLISHESYLLYKHPVFRIINPSRLKRLVRAFFVLKRFDSIYVSRIKQKSKVIALLTTVLLKLKLLPLGKMNLKSIERRIEKIKKFNNPTQWQNYHDKFHLDQSVLETNFRFNRIIKLLEPYRCKVAFEVAGNQGFFAKLLLEKSDLHQIYCSDYDENAVDQMFIHNNGNQRFSPVYMNLLFPIETSFTLSSHTRFKADVVFALAVSHHILLTQKQNIDSFLATLCLFTNRLIAVEFMPLGLYDGKTAPPIPDWYTVDWFREHLRRHCNIINEENLDVNRIFFLAERINVIAAKC